MKQPPFMIRLGRLVAMCLLAVSAQATWAQEQYPETLNSPSVASGAGDDTNMEMLPTPDENAELYRLPRCEDDDVHTMLDGPMFLHSPPPVNLPKPLPEDILKQASKALRLEAMRPSSYLPNLGTERVAFALFEIDSAVPRDIARVRFDTAFGMDRPDRAEYFWKKVGSGGPQWNGRAVNYQELRFHVEKTVGKSSGFMELPFRRVRALDARKHSGLSDLQIGTKSLLHEGEDLFGIPTPGNPDDKWRLSSVFRTYISLSSKLAERGLSTGHGALEPGLLAQYEVSPYTFFHSELKCWFGLGGTAGSVGNVLRYGLGVSHVYLFTPPDLHSQFHFAMIPTLELVGWEFLSGGETTGGMPETVSSSGDSVVNIQPGLRIPLGKRVEAGFSAAARLTRHHIYDDLFRFEMRWFH